MLKVFLGFEDFLSIDWSWDVNSFLIMNWILEWICLLEVIEVDEGGDIDCSKIIEIKIKKEMC